MLLNVIKVTNDYKNSRTLITEKNLSGFCVGFGRTRTVARRDWSEIRRNEINRRWLRSSNCPSGKRFSDRRGRFSESGRAPLARDVENRCDEGIHCSACVSGRAVSRSSPVRHSTTNRAQASIVLSGIALTFNTIWNFTRHRTSDPCVSSIRAICKHQYTNV